MTKTKKTKKRSVVPQAAHPYVKNAAEALTSHGYGLSREQMELALTAIPEGLLEQFLYTLARLAEKRGQDPFWQAHRDGT